MERSRALLVRLYSAVRDRRRHNKPHALYGRAFSGNIDSGKYHVEPKNGWFTIPDRPGIGQELSTQAMKEAITETIQ